ncbi:hypothetical protein CYMTET_40230 [Cymbomonas tetramitiformis]|uniref:Uncharacterized protein n=1 Tax=Cymbomonas tetramitiformis TaxID=36881 RepID=A0AAE0CAB1_9CHLO|nr:hypothetical protein CYMTET_40230 [Cymbomonas tetramitiformis]
MNDRHSNRATRSARARRPVRRERQPVIPAPQGALPLPAVPVLRTATSAPSSAVSVVASLLRSADAAPDRPPPPLEQRLDSQLSIQATEFQPQQENLESLTTPMLDHAELVRGEGTPIDAVTTVNRRPPTTVRRARGAGAHLLPIQPGAVFMQETPIRRGVFVAVTPARSASVASEATPHTWSGAHVQTEHGALPSPYGQGYADHLSTTATRSTTSSARPVDTPYATDRGHEPRQAPRQRSDVPDWRVPRQAHDLPSEGERPAAGSAGPSFSLSSIGGETGVSAGPSFSLSSIGGETDGLSAHTHSMHHASSPVTRTITELPNTMLGRGATPSMAPTAPRPSPVVTERTPSLRMTVPNDSYGPAPPPLPIAQDVGGSEGPEQQVSQSRPPSSATGSERQSGSQIPIRHVEFSPGSVAFAEPVIREGSRRQRRRDRLETYMNSGGLPRRSGSLPLTDLHSGAGGAGMLPPAIRPASTENSAAAIQQQIATYLQSYHQQLLLQYPAVFSPAPSTPLPEVPPASSPPPPEPESSSSSAKSEPPPVPSDPSPSPPPSEGDHPALVVLLWTQEGESFWLTTKFSGISVDFGDGAKYRFRLPSARLSGAATEMDSVWSTLHYVGLNIQDLAAYGAVRVPERLDVEEGLAYSLLVTRAQVTAARKATDQRSVQRRLPMFAWVTIPSTALESDITEFDPLGIQAWTMLTSTEAYLFRDIPSNDRVGTATPASAAPPVILARPSAVSERSAALPVGMLPIHSAMSQFPGHHDLMGEASPETVYRESKTVADILKLVKNVPRYPDTDDLVSTDADISALPPFTGALTDLVSHGVVKFALARMSAYKLGQTVISMPELLREVAQRCLRTRSLTFVKQGGIMNSDTWSQRYSSLAPFLADVARSVLDDIALVGLAGTVMRLMQRREETTRAFATRLVGWVEVTQLLADTMPGCPSIGRQQLLYQFWSGLRLRQTVMDKLVDDRLSLQRPEEWEREHPNSTALQHIITVATKAEHAEKLANPRQAMPTSSSTPSQRSPWRGGRSSAKLNAVQDTGEEGQSDTQALTIREADLCVQQSAPQPPSFTRPPRRCFVCGSEKHLWAACPDEEKKKAWVADAPARLARRRAANDAQVAALEFDLDDLEDEADALDLFQCGELTAAASSEQSTADHHQ